MLPELTADQKDVLLRWRLCLGRRSDSAVAYGRSFPVLGLDVAGGGVALPGWSLDGRDLVDMDALLRHFGANADFWQNLQSRAAELDHGPARGRWKRPRPTVRPVNSESLWAPWLSPTSSPPSSTRRGETL